MATRRGSLLALCAEGLQETRHPYATVARLAFADLAALESAGPLEEEELRRVMTGLRQALMVETGGGARTPVTATATGVFEHGLLALRQMAIAEGPCIVPHLPLVLPPIGKKMFLKAHRDSVQDILRCLERHCGPEAVKIMRRRGVSAGVA